MGIFIVRQLVRITVERSGSYLNITASRLLIVRPAGPVAPFVVMVGVGDCTVAVYGVGVGLGAVSVICYT